MMCADGCPMKICCLARLSDPTIVGCSVPEYVAGKVRREEIIVYHGIREGKNDTGRSNQTRRRKS